MRKQRPLATHPERVRWRAMRERLSEAQNHRCCYCGIRMDGSGKAPDAPTVEHLHPTSKGGSWHEDNLVMACARCNVLMRDVPAWMKMRAFSDRRGKRREEARRIIGLP